MLWFLTLNNQYCTPSTSKLIVSSVIRTTAGRWHFLWSRRSTDEATTAGKKLCMKTKLSLTSCIKTYPWIAIFFLFADKWNRRLNRHEPVQWFFCSCISEWTIENNCTSHNFSFGLLPCAQWIRNHLVWALWFGFKTNLDKPTCNFCLLDWPGVLHSSFASWNSEICLWTLARIYLLISTYA